ncbi:hypothetical protein LJC23_02610 [Desulfovibrio sp. OttesenSCG-928-I05]|nr:hypothetical protein [Desulfovibrio sp. OttesenSCG-928-O18]MDL2271906.1 hypothetical protein [Desulfovibrio sp. OttesenSCG-928-I05]
MNSDIRLAVSFRGHRKRKRLRKVLGPDSTDFLIDLWIGAAMTHPTGILHDMDETDIALEAGWEKEPQEFIDALLECRFLEKTEHGSYALHDWEDHQGYVIHAERRKAQARNAAATRWKNRQGDPAPEAEAQHAGSNAPSPDPVPELIPVPEPVPVALLSSQPAPAAGSPKRKREKAPAPVFAEDSEPHRLAVLMRDTLQRNLRTFMEPDIQEWARTFNTAILNDARMKDTQFVAQVIRWACSEPFWRGVIHHPGRLRKNFEQLTLKMEAESTAPRNQSSAERRVEQNKAACQKAKVLLFGDKSENGHAGA